MILYNISEVNSNVYVLGNVYVFRCCFVFPCYAESSDLLYKMVACVSNVAFTIGLRKRFLSVLVNRNSICFVLIKDHSTPASPTEKEKIK